MRIAVVDSGGEGKCRVRGRVDLRAVKSDSVGIRGGILRFGRRLCVCWLRL